MNRTGYKGGESQSENSTVDVQVTTAGQAEMTFPRPKVWIKDTYFIDILSLAVYFPYNINGCGPERIVWCADQVDRG